MHDQDNRTREQLLQEVANLRDRVAQLEASAEQLKESEERLRQSEAKYRVIFENEIYAIGIFDLESRRLLEVNEAFARLYGYSQAELLAGMSIDDLTAEPEATNMAIKQGVRQGQVFVPLRYHRKKDGAIFPVEIVSGPYWWQGRTVIFVMVHDITARQQAEEEKKRNDLELLFLNELIELTTQPLSVADVEGRLIRFNHALEQLTGYSRAELHQLTYQQITPEHWRDLEARQVAHLLATGQAVRYEKEYRRKDGSLAPVELVVELYRDAAGEPKYLYAFPTDISERKQAEAALARERALLRTVIDLLPEAIYAKDAAGRKTLSNQTDVHISGAQLETQILGKTDAELYPPDIAARLESDDQTVIQTGAALLNCEEIIPAPDGQRRWFLTSKVPLRDAAGQVIGLVGVGRDITARKQATEALRLSEERYRLLIESIHDSVYVLDEEWRHIIVNEAGAQFTGIPKDKLVGAKLTELFPGVENTPFFKAFQRVMETREPDVVSNEFTFADGRKEWYEVNVYPAPEGILCVSHNITGRKRAEELLRASEEKFRQIIERSGDAIILIDETGRIVEWNAAAEQLTDLARAEALGRPSWEIQFDLLPAERRTPATYEQIKTSSQSYFQTGQDPWLNRVSEFELQRPDGSYRDIQTADFAVKTSLGFWRGSIMRDVTEPKQIERVEAAKLTVSHILAASPDPAVALRQLLESIAGRLEWQLANLWRPDEAGRYLTWQDGWFTPDRPELTEFNQASQGYIFEPGEGLAGTVWQAGRAIWDKYLRLARAADAALAAKVGFRSASGIPIIMDGETVGVMTFFSRSARPLDERLLATLTDLGRQIGQFLARKRVEADLAAERASLVRRVEERTAELSQANAELIRAMQAKDEFLATMSHELRTPLNGILTMAEVLQVGVYGPLNERQLNSMGVIEQSGQLLLVLINDVLDLAKIGAGTVELELQLVAAVDICQASLLLVKEMAAKKNVQLSFRLTDWSQSLDLRADPRRLKQVLVNLLSNAVKFTPAGGQVSLEVRAAPEQQAIHFAVQDTGIGIAPEDRAKLFQPFTQVDAKLSRQYEGAGLGLALVQQLVELHGGTVAVESEGAPGRGSRFTVSLPWPSPA